MTPKAAARFRRARGGTNWDHGDVDPWNDVQVITPDGVDLVEEYQLVSADDSTPQFPDGGVGTVHAYVGPEGNMLRKGEHVRSLRIGVFRIPGIEIRGHPLFW